MPATPRSELRMGKQGRIVVPAEIRESLGLSEGDRLIARVEDGALYLATVRANLDRARRIVRQHVAADRSLVDELIADRRAEANREDAR